MLLCVLRSLLLLALFALAVAEQADVTEVCAEDAHKGSRVTSKRAQAMLQASRHHSGAPAQQACDWVVHYNTWIPSFNTSEYEHNGPLGGAHCLEACCRDPDCQGLALKSSETNQCYRYRALPVDLKPQRGRLLADGKWLLNSVPAWSVFVKRKADAIPHPPAVQAPNSGLVVAPGIGSKFSAVQHACTWAVFYDKWIPSFEQGEYKHAGVKGNAHCLEACCQDPTCTGIQYESSELDQCYKYRSLPNAISNQKGAPLGDGQWLASKKNAWSIFVKSDLILQPHLAPADKDVAYVRFGPPPVGQIGAYVAITTLVMYCFVADTFAKRLAEKFGLVKANPETKHLLGRF